MPNADEITIICSERQRKDDNEYRAYVAIAISSVENMLNGLKPLIVHQYLDYLEGRKTVLGKFFDVLSALGKLNSKIEKGENDA